MRPAGVWRSAGTETLRFVKAEAHIHVLDSLPGGAFDQIIDRGQNDPVATLVDSRHLYDTMVRPDGMAQSRQFPDRQQMDERLFGVGIYIQVTHGLFAH